MDPQVSERWIERPLGAGRILAPAAWAEDLGFYERLIDEDPAAVQAFREARAAMDREHGPVAELPLALDLGEGWLQCPRCADAWEAPPHAASLRCANGDCGALLRDPR